MFISLLTSFDLDIFHFIITTKIIPLKLYLIFYAAVLILANTLKTYQAVCPTIKIDKLKIIKCFVCVLWV